MLETYIEEGEGWTPYKRKYDLASENLYSSNLTSYNSIKSYNPKYYERKRFLKYN